MFDNIRNFNGCRKRFHILRMLSSPEIEIFKRCCAFKSDHGHTYSSHVWCEVVSHYTIVWVNAFVVRSATCERNLSPGFAGFLHSVIMAERGVKLG